jgi:hypothetical protein
MELSHADRELVDLFARTARGLGFSEGLARTYAVLFVAEEPLSQGDLSRLTGFSVPKVSTQLAKLSGGMDVVRVRRAGDRRGYYACSHTMTDYKALVLFKLVPLLRAGLAELRVVREGYAREGNRRMARRLDELGRRHAALLEVLARLGSSDPAEVLAALEAGKRTRKASKRAKE